MTMPNEAAQAQESHYLMGIADHMENPAGCLADYRLQDDGCGAPERPRLYDYYSGA